MSEANSRNRYVTLEFREFASLIPETGTLKFMIRVATLKDIDELLRIEQTCFNTDQLSRRSFRYLLTKARAHTLVAEVKGTLCGYAMLLFSKKTASARLYSFAVDSQFRRQGIATKLLQAAEDVAYNKYNCVSLHLETRRDNIAMQQLVNNCGYQKFGTFANYYEDLMEAWRFEKSLRKENLK
jgi:ribosomal protein S18 acetylase RimI-like enzyme